MNRFGLLEVHAKEKISAPDGWTVYAFESWPPHGDPQIIRLSGGIEGKDEHGHSTWGEPRSEAFITPTEHKEWLAAWARRTGLCSTCEGNGEVFARWTLTTGTQMKTCPKCNGSKVAEVAS